MSENHESNKDDNCIFCKIIDGKIPAAKIYEDENTIGIKDLHPRAPIHYLFIPKKHIRNLEEINSSNSKIIADLNLAAIETAKKENVATSGFRTVINCNSWAGQTVFHLHLHLLAGKHLSEDM